MDDFIFIKTGNRILLLNKSQVVWIQGRRKSVVIHLPTQTYSLSADIEYVQSKLDPASFLRINSSTIINLNKIRQVETWLRGSYRIWLENGANLILSSSYRHRLKELLRCAIG